MSAALSDRDTNERFIAPSTTTLDNKHMAAGSENKPHEGQPGASNNMRRQMFAAGNGEQAGSKAYVSPSDAIQSPASQKLATFKQKQITKQYVSPMRSYIRHYLTSSSRNRGAKNPTARSLFARTASSCSFGGFEDVQVHGKDQAEAGR